MDILKLAENGPVLISPNVYKDERGYFFESFNEEQFKKEVADITFVQDNESRSAYGVIRGLHFQKGEHAQAKLVRVVNGAVIDVAVDIRPESPTYRRAFFVYLSEENHRQFFIPRGFAHGFLSLREGTVFQYKCDNLYNKESEGSYFFADPAFDIPWATWINQSDVKISQKDSQAPMLTEPDAREDQLINKEENDVDEQ